MAKELSIFVDESGDRGGKARYYLLTLVFHDQADSIAEAVTGYEAKLARTDLPNIPFHSEPLTNGHKDYEFLGIEQRRPCSPISPRSSANFPFPISRSSTAAASSKTRQG